MAPSLNLIESKRRQQNQIITRLQDYILSYGYALIDLPIIQPADLFLTKVGDELINKLFTFERFGQQLALRPEFTASAAFHFAQQKTNQVVRWQFAGPIFIDDPNNFTHDYQQQSLGAELIGLDSAIADAEIIALAVKGLDTIGATGGYLKLGHVGLIRQLLTHFKLDSRTERFLLNHLSAFKDAQLGKSYIIEQLEKSLLGTSMPAVDLNPVAISEQNMDYTTQEALGLLLDATQRGMTMGGRSRHDIARRLLQKHRRIADKEHILQAVDFLENLSSISDYSLAEGLSRLETLVKDYNLAAQGQLDNWRDIIDLLAAYDIPVDRIRLHPELVRGWDYYTGAVFELYSADGVHLGGGGRYDELIALVGNSASIPAVGFAYYLDDLLAVMPNNDSPSQVLYRLVINPEAVHQVSWWAHHLREQGVHVMLTAESPEMDTIFVNDAGQAVFQGNTYSDSQLRSLISDLQQR